LRGNPSSLRLEVCSLATDAMPSERVTLRHGTAWLSGEHTVVTAFHVVGSKGGQYLPSRWRHQIESSPIKYFIVDPLHAEMPVQVRPDTFDADSDLALLTLDLPKDNEIELARIRKWLRESVVVASPSEHQDDAVEPNTPWSAEGFPNVSEGLFKLTGKVTAVHPQRLQLTVDQGTLIHWAGMSGSPVLQGEWIIGVITDDIKDGNTVLVTSIDAIEQLHSKSRKRSPSVARRLPLAQEVVRIVSAVFRSPEAWEKRITELDTHILPGFPLVDLSRRQWGNKEFIVFLSRCGISVLFCVSAACFLTLALSRLAPQRPDWFPGHVAIAGMSAATAALGIGLAVSIACGLAASIAGVLFGCVAAIIALLHGVEDPLSVCGAAGGGAAGAAASVFLHVAPRSISAPRISLDLKRKRLAFIEFLMIVVGLTIFAPDAVLSLPNTDWSPASCAVAASLLAIPTAAVCWWKRRRQARIPRPYTGFGFVGRLLLFSALIGAFLGATTSPAGEHCFRVACLAPIGLVSGAILSGIFDFAVAWFQYHFYARAGLLFLVFLCLAAFVALFWPGMPRFIGLGVLISSMFVLVAHHKWSTWQELG
jgi:hypothetical protein